jgi:hypothetical protein
MKRYRKKSTRRSNWDLNAILGGDKEKLAAIEKAETMFGEGCTDRQILQDLSCHFAPYILDDIPFWLREWREQDGNRNTNVDNNP